MRKVFQAVFMAVDFLTFKILYFFSSFLSDQPIIQLKATELRYIVFLRILYICAAQLRSKCTLILMFLEVCG